QLGVVVVRTIALGSTDGLRRGLKVANTEAPKGAVSKGEGAAERIYGARPHASRRRPRRLLSMRVRSEALQPAAPAYQEQVLAEIALSRKRRQKNTIRGLHALVP
ncbi:MAG: hypothetical protein L0Y57_08080, partial [Beijerinckiaceae bacterium]|nr:hypothetical protein [Beijerinckiaceae bacterium]